MQAVKLNEVFVESFCDELHDLCSFAGSRHAIAVPAHSREERDVVPIAVLTVKESGVEQDVRPRRFHPEGIPGNRQFVHHQLGDLRKNLFII